MHAETHPRDPKHLGFVLARYHFVSRILAGFDQVLEVGCGDCTGAPVVKAAVRRWEGIDKDPLHNGPDVRMWDIVDFPYMPPTGWWNAVYALDVLEHITKSAETLFFKNICTGLHEHGTVIIGSPSLESQPFASALSKRHHVNCKTEDELRSTLRGYFHNVYLFGMNDCTLHTGFGPLCHYRLAICAGKR
jgi:hypothetical protein